MLKRLVIKRNEDVAKVIMRQPAIVKPFEAMQKL